jgi:zinc transporter, ZIP family
MATTTPLRWLRRVGRRGSRGGVLAAFCLLMGLVLGLAAGLVARGWEARTTEPQRTAPPSGSLEVGQTLLCPGAMVFQLRNDGAQPVTIAQVSVNDAFWPFTARPSTTITSHRTASVTVGYTWAAGLAYEVHFISSTGATYETDIDASTTASAPPCP